MDKPSKITVRTKQAQVTPKPRRFPENIRTIPRKRHRANAKDLRGSLDTLVFAFCFLTGWSLHGSTALVLVRFHAIRFSCSTGNNLNISRRELEETSRWFFNPSDLFFEHAIWNQASTVYLRRHPPSSFLPCLFHFSCVHTCIARSSLSRFHTSSNIPGQKMRLPCRLCPPPFDCVVVRRSSLVCVCWLWLWCGRGLGGVGLGCFCGWLRGVLGRFWGGENQKMWHGCHNPPENQKMWHACHQHGLLVYYGLV